MNAQLKIYADCTSEEPTKVYTCRRLLFKTSKEINSLAEKLQGKSEEEQIAINIQVIKTIFPDFQDEEFDFIDPVEWVRFVNEIGQETAKIVGQAQKN
jgi:hypothetical protein